MLFYFFRYSTKAGIERCLQFPHDFRMLACEIVLFAQILL